MITTPAQLVRVTFLVLATICGLLACVVVASAFYYSEGRLDPAGIQIGKKVDVVSDGEGGVQSVRFSEESNMYGYIMDPSGRRVAYVPMRNHSHSGEKVEYLRLVPTVYFGHRPSIADHVLVAGGVIMFGFAAAIGARKFGLEKDQQNPAPAHRP